jgi:hypothetical protein
VDEAEDRGEIEIHDLIDTSFIVDNQNYEIVKDHLNSFLYIRTLYTS